MPCCLVDTWPDLNYEVANVNWGSNVAQLITCCQTGHRSPSDWCNSSPCCFQLVLIVPVEQIRNTLIHPHKEYNSQWWLIGAAASFLDSSSVIRRLWIFIFHSLFFLFLSTNVVNLKRRKLWDEYWNRGFCFSEYLYLKDPRSTDFCTCIYKLFTLKQMKRSRSIERGIVRSTSRARGWWIFHKEFPTYKGSNE